MVLLNVFLNVRLPRTLTPGPCRGNEANINTDVHLDRVWLFGSKLPRSRQPSAFHCAQTSVSESFDSLSDSTGRGEHCGGVFFFFTVIRLNPEAVRKFCSLV